MFTGFPSDFRWLFLLLILYFLRELSRMELILLFRCMFCNLPNIVLDILDMYLLDRDIFYFRRLFFRILLQFFLFHFFLLYFFFWFGLLFILLMLLLICQTNFLFSLLPLCLFCNFITRIILVIRFTHLCLFFSFDWLWLSEINIYC